MVKNLCDFMKLKKISDVVWEFPKTGKMNVPCRVYGNTDIVNSMEQGVYDQITNVASLPGIIKNAFCMPDGHFGYGFPIGGVAAFDSEKGVISPGGVGFDINCGMRLVTMDLDYNDVKSKIKDLVDILFNKVPTGVGCSGFVKMDSGKFREVMEEGAVWAIKEGYGWDEDLKLTEEYGKMEADSSKVSNKAVKRGLSQIGTLGSGNHYLEIQRAGEIFDEQAAKAYGITRENQIVVMFHCGSRGFGHQIGTDYLQKFLDVMPRYGIEIDDKELACAPFQSQEGQDYYEAMKCGINMSFANRQVILHRIRESFEKVFGKSSEDLEMRQVYDVAHNTAKVEKHKVDGKMRNVVVHRKGSTRAFGSGRSEVPEKHRNIGQAVIIGGSMETGSWLLKGTDKAMDDTFGSTCHGSGRTMSRAKAKRIWRGDKLLKDMEKRGIYVKSASMSGVAEEAGGAYKDVDSVINSVHDAGISTKVVKLLPLGNIKG